MVQWSMSRKNSGVQYGILAIVGPRFAVNFKERPDDRR